VNALPEVGTTSNRYTILGRLAGGGMADIFLTRVTTEAGVDRHVVLKRVLAERSNDPHFATMFLDEARLASQLHHPNIAQVYDIGKLAGSYFFTMEYIHGEDTRHVLQRLAGLRRKLPINHTLHITSSALLALHHAHERTSPAGKPLGIVHRDVTPSNLMIAYDGCVKLLDFGVAKAAERAVESRSGTIKGKIAYLSPEQCKGDKIDRRSDIYSLGIVLYEMLTSRRLYRRDTDFATMIAIVNEDIPKPSSHNPDVGDEIDAIVAKALAKDPDQRYASAAAMIEAIEAVAEAKRLVLTVSALGKFMRELYGERPEPWIELEQQESDSRAITITSEAITLGKDALAGAKGLAGASTLEFPTLDTPARDAIEAQLQHAPTLGRADRGGGSDENESFEPVAPATEVATRDHQTKPALTRTVDLRAGSAPAPVEERTETLAAATAVQAAPAPAPARPGIGRRLALIAGASAIGVAAIVLAIGFTGKRVSSPPAPVDAAAATISAAPPPRRDAAVAAAVPDAAVAVPTIAAAIARSDWDGALALCRASKPNALDGDDRVRCGKAACSAAKKALAMTYLQALAPAAQAELDRECRAHGIVLIAPRTKDPCETNPLKCRKP